MGCWRALSLDRRNSFYTRLREALKENFGPDGGALRAAFSPSGSLTPSSDITGRFLFSTHLNLVIQKTGPVARISSLGCLFDFYFMVLQIEPEVPHELDTHFMAG